VERGRGRTCCLSSCWSGLMSSVSLLGSVQGVTRAMASSVHLHHHSTISHGHRGATARG
jgi:hypothetical protein